MTETVYRCDHCQQEFLIDHRTEFDGKVLCPDCLALLTSFCSHCDTRFWRNELHTRHDVTLCGRCLDNYYSCCCECGRLVPNEELHYLNDDDNEGYCDICCHSHDPSQTVQSYYYKPEPIFYGEGKRFMGVELEIDEGGESNPKAAQIMHIANRDGLEQLYVKHDGSLNDGMELVSHPMTLNYHRNEMPWPSILHEAVQLGYTSHQTRTCGLHVHVNRTAFGETHAKQEDVIARILFFVENHWNELLPVTEVAKKYKVSDVAIHKVCKSLEVPTPPLGYWAKLRAGKPVVKTPLPESTKGTTKIGMQTGYVPPLETNQNTLEFLGEEDRAAVMAVAAQILLPEENERMHSKIIAHRKVVTEWKKQEKRNANDKWRPRNAPPPPLLANTISDASIPRACRIIDALIKAMEPLGCKLTDNLKFVINGETVGFSFSESQDKIDHIPTKEENRRLLEYEEERRKYSYASKPQIRKYDYQYNGRLSLTINHQKSFCDCKTYQLEDRLGDMMLELYAAAEVLRQQRLAREEAERKRKEEERRKEERRKRYNTEVDRTLALSNIAEDYDIACKIRRYISAYEATHPDEDISEWVAWANAKADWYDPTISREDELLGKRDHAKAKDAKTPKYSGYW